MVGSSIVTTLSLKAWPPSDHHACMRAVSFQSCPALCDPMYCCPPVSSVHGIFQARILECVAMPSFRGSSRPKDWTHVSYVSWLAGEFFTISTAWKAPDHHVCGWLWLTWPESLMADSLLRSWLLLLFCFFQACQLQLYVCISTVESLVGQSLWLYMGG